MKKVLFSLLTLIAMVAMTSCGSNDTEKKLNGKWETKMTESGTDMTMVWNLDADSHKCDITLNVGMGQMDMATMKFYGSWKASSDKIAFSIDEDKCDISFSDEFKQMTGASDADLKQLEDQTVSEFKKELAGMAEEELVSVDETTLVVKEQGRNVTFTRVK